MKSSERKRARERDCARDGKKEREKLHTAVKYFSQESRPVFYS